MISLTRNQLRALAYMALIQRGGGRVTARDLSRFTSGSGNPSIGHRFMTDLLERGALSMDRPSASATTYSVTPAGHALIADAKLGGEPLRLVRMPHGR